MAQTKEKIPMSKLYIIYGHLIWKNERGQRHRDPKLGPSCIASSGYTSYMTNDKVHNPYGPARIWENGRKDYYLIGNMLSFIQWKKQRKQYL